MKSALPMSLPKDPRHQRFADLILAGENAANAYGGAGFTARSPKARAAAACRLLKREDVQAYLKEIRGRAADESTMTLLERRQFYARIKRTPLMSIDPNDPGHKDGDLIKKFKRSTTESAEVFEIEKLDPLKACELDTKAAGDDPDANAMNALAEAIGRLGSSSPLPTGKM